MKYQDYISEWLVYGKHNKKSDCDCVACRMQRELEAANPVFYTAADLAKAREDGRREAIKKLLVLGADGLGVYYDTGDRIVVGRRTYLIDADVFDALLGEKEEK